MKIKIAGIKQLIRLLALVICGTILGINLYSFNANRLIGNQMPMPFGYGAAVVLSGSMEPTLSKGDLIVVKQAEKFEENEVVVYQEDNYLVVHRIIYVEEDHVITKGDANDVSDLPVEISQVKGKVVLCLPAVGNVVNFLKTPAGIVLTIILAILLIELPRRKEQEQYDEERQKLIEEIRRLKDEA